MRNLFHALCLLFCAWDRGVAQSTEWVGGPLGNWFTGAWSNGVPTSGSDALINSGLVEIGTHVSTATTGSLVVAGTNTGSFSGLGISNNDFFSISLLVARDPGSQGLVTASVGSQMTSIGSVEIGRSGTALFQVTRGAELAGSQVDLGVLTGSNGTLELDGSGSELNMFSFSDDSSLRIGMQGRGTLNVTNHSAVRGASNIYVELGSSGGNGTLKVIDAGSTMTVYEVAAKSGTVEISAGGVLTVDEDILLGTNGNASESRMIVSGVGSQVFSERFRVGSASGSGVLEVQNGGLVQLSEGFQVGGTILSTVTIGNATLSTPVFTAIDGLESELALEEGALVDAGILTLSEESHLQITLGGLLATEFGRMMGNMMHLNGTFELLLADSYVPAEGDAFSLLAFASMEGSFDDLSLPSLGSGLIWDISIFESQGVLLVVPEPTSVGLLLLAGGIGMWSRTIRRRL